MATSPNFLTRNFTKLNVRIQRVKYFFSVHLEEDWGLAKQTGSRVTGSKFEIARLCNACD